MLVYLRGVTNRRSSHHFIQAICVLNINLSNLLIAV